MPTPPPPAPARKPRPARSTLEALTAKEFMLSFTNATLAAPDALTTALATPLKLEKGHQHQCFQGTALLPKFRLGFPPQKRDNARCKGKKTFEEQYRQADPSHHHPNACVCHQERTYIGSSRASGWFLGFLEGSGGLNKSFGHHWEVIRRHVEIMKKLLGGGWKSLGSHNRNWQVIRSRLEVTRSHNLYIAVHCRAYFTPWEQVQE